MANVQELYDRFKGPKSGSKLVYPLENQSDYLGRITFTPIQEGDFDLPDENLKDLATDFIKKGKDAITDGAAAAWQGVKDYLFVDGDKEGEFDQELIDKQKTNMLYGITAGGSKVQASAGGGAAEALLALNTDSRISLYLPRAIQIQDTVSYDNAFQLGLIGGAIEKDLSGGQGVAASALGAVAGEIAGIGNSLIGNASGAGMSKEAAGIIAGKVAAMAPRIGDAAGGAVRGATRLTTNPNTRALFKDVPIRNFSFAFQLLPTSRAEARIIEEIISTFRTELYPEAISASGVNIGYRFPNRFLIKVKYNNKEIPGIRFLPVYLQSFNATYNSATGGMHNDGRFTSIDISLAFTETRAIAKADVKEGF